MSMHCARCGGAIDDNATFCTFCGEKIHFSQKGFMPAYTLQAQSTAVAGQTNYAGGNTQYAQDSVAQFKASSQKQKKPVNKLAIAAIACAVAGVVAIGIGLFSLALPGSATSDSERHQSTIDSLYTDNSSDADDADSDSGKSNDFSVTKVDGTAETGTEKGSDEDVLEDGGSGGSGSSSGISLGALTDTDAYKILLEAYDEADVYNSEISEVARYFNSHYTDSSYSSRSEGARIASDLKAEIYNDWKDLEDMEMPFWSVNYSAWEDMCLLYSYLYGRIDVICDAWDISLKYDDPSAHIDEILEPIENARGPSGSNQDYQDYLKLYPTITLVKP